jgi:shikimate dehydrogenase
MHAIEYALIGRTLAHSCSPELHGLLHSYKYNLLELEPSELEPFLRARNFRGLNVTIPYKRCVLPLCDSLSERARQIGAVNTIVHRSDGTLFGDNTDYPGFIFACSRAGITFEGERVLILGNGGTSQTVQCAVRDMGAEKIVVLSRDKDTQSDERMPVIKTPAEFCTYGEIDKFRHFTRIINTTPVGMYPRADAQPLVSLRDFASCGGVADVIYNPLRTQLVQDAQALGIPATGGLPMLAAQAKYAGDLFTGEALPDDAIEAALTELLRTRENIALIGMPGCGKSTVGKLLARQLGLLFVDADTELELRTGRRIPEIFANSGEELFRALESETLAELCAHGGQVIAAGGGAVLRPENRSALRRNSRVVWIRRDLDKLATEGRPLSQDADAPARLWAEREPLYRAAADLTADNSTAMPEDCAAAVLRGLGV